MFPKGTWVVVNYIYANDPESIYSLDGEIGYITKAENPYSLVLMKEGGKITPHLAAEWLLPNTALTIKPFEVGDKVFIVEEMNGFDINGELPHTVGTEGTIKSIHKYFEVLVFFSPEISYWYRMDALSYSKEPVVNNVVKERKWKTINGDSS